MVEYGTPITEQVQVMIEAGGGGGGTNIKSGISTSPKAVERQVNFVAAFLSIPRVVLTPTADKGVWITEVAVGYFKWNNNSKNTDVTVHWLATTAGNL